MLMPWSLGLDTDANSVAFLAPSAVHVPNNAYSKFTLQQLQLLSLVGPTNRIRSTIS